MLFDLVPVGACIALIRIYGYFYTLMHKSMQHVCALFRSHAWKLPIAKGGCRQPDETPDRVPADPGHLGSEFEDLNEKRKLLEEFEREATRQEEEVRLESLRIQEFEARQSQEAANVAEHGAELHEEQQKLEREHEALVKAQEATKAKQLALDKKREEAKEEKAHRSEAARASMEEKERG